MAKQVQRAIGWVAAFLLAVGMLFLPVSKAYAGPVSGGSPGRGGKAVLNAAFSLYILHITI